MRPTPILPPPAAPKRKRKRRSWLLSLLGFGFASAVVMFLAAAAVAGFFFWKAARDLPDYVYMPCYLGWGQAIRRPGPYAGFLGQRCDPLFTECKPHLDPGARPESPGHPQVLRGAPLLPEAATGGDLTLDRLDARPFEKVGMEFAGLDSGGIAERAPGTEALEPACDKNAFGPFGVGLITRAQPRGQTIAPLAGVGCVVGEAHRAQAVQAIGIPVALLEFAVGQLSDAKVKKLLACASDRDFQLVAPAITLLRDVPVGKKDLKP